MPDLNPNPSNIKDYMGVPVLVQLRFPLAAVTLRSNSRGRIPYASEPDRSQWVPEALMLEGSPSGTQLVQAAVLFEVAGGHGGHSVVEMRWSSLPEPPPPGSTTTAPGPLATLATLLDVRDIVAITRVVGVAEPSSLILKA